ncbi:hypothetical protein FHG87_012779 [Trinorchestia longiramus]|nr:hypothetical protein FHG87_012779 [Trinorchestia longiramus]
MSATDGTRRNLVMSATDGTRRNLVMSATDDTRRNLVMSATDGTRRNKRETAGSTVPATASGTELPAAGVVQSSLNSGTDFAARFGWGRRWFFKKVSEENTGEADSPATKSPTKKLPKERTVGLPSSESAPPIRRHPFVRRAATEPNVIVYNSNRRRSSLGLSGLPASATIVEEDEEETALLEQWESNSRTMSVICFVCNLPILSHQVGLLWEGGNGWDDIQSDDSTPRATRTGRRDSSAQITTIDPPTEVQETSPPTSRRRRSSIAQLTDILRDWGRRDTENRSTGTSTSTSSLIRRESRDSRVHRDSLAEIAKSLPWGSRRDSAATEVPKIKMRRESSTESRKRRQSGTDIKNDIAKLFTKRESVGEIIRRRRDSIEQERKERRDSTTQVYSRYARRFEKNISPEITSPRVISPELKEKDLIPRTTMVITQASAESGVSLVSQLSGSAPDGAEPSTSAEPRSPMTSPVPTSPTPTWGRRDSQMSRGRRDSRPQASPERGSARGSREPSPKYRSLRRQSTAIEEGPIQCPRRDSRPYLLPDASEPSDGLPRKYRRDSLSPDSAAAENVPFSRKTRRDSRPRLSPEPSDGNSRETSPRTNLRRQSTTAIEYAGRGRRSSRSPRSPDSSSTCSSREHSPKERRLRRQSTTEEILKSTGFRRQSTTEDIMRARNFRRQSTQSEEMSKTRGRRDSCAQITDGTLATMTIETSCAFFDTSTQTGEFNVQQHVYLGHAF